MLRWLGLNVVRFSQTESESEVDFDAFYLTSSRYLSKNAVTSPVRPGR